jgi:hypothetical protein
MGLQFTIAAGPRQHSHSQVRLPRTRDHILLSQIRDSPNLEGQVPAFKFPRNRVAQSCLQAMGCISVASASYDLLGYGEGIRPLLHMGCSLLRSHCSICLVYNPSARIAYRTSLLIVAVQSLPWDHVCLRSRYSVTARIH